LERLEGECYRLRRNAQGWWRAGGLALVGAVVLLVGGARDADTPKTIEADELIIRDETGMGRIRLGATNGHAALRLTDTQGKVRFSAFVHRDGGVGLDLTDGTVNTPIHMQVGKDGWPYVFIKGCSNGSKVTLSPERLPAR
jgi:hypothetical protein